MMRKARNGIAESVTIALIALASALITVVFEKETNNTITNIIYDVDDTNKTKCIEKSYNIKKKEV